MRIASLSTVLCFVLFLQGCGGDGGHTAASAEADFPASLQSFVETEDTDNDGHVDEIHSYEVVYDGSGSISRAGWECDHDFNGVIDNKTSYFYNNDGKPAQEYYFYDNDDDYNIDSTDAVAFSYDSSGKLLQEVVHTDIGQDGEIDTTITYTYVYDLDGNRIEKRKEKISDVVESGYVETYAYTFAADGKLDGYTVTKSDPDAAADEISTLRLAYNAAGNVEEMIVSTDSDGDGHPDRVTTSTFTYLETGRLETAVAELDVNGDGASDLRYSEEFTYDANNSPTRLDGRALNLADNTVTTSGVQTITYSADGKGVETRVVIDVDGDGDDDSSIVYEIRFTEKGMTNRTYPVEIAHAVTIPFPLVSAINNGEFPF